MEKEKIQNEGSKANRKFTAEIDEKNR